MRGKGTGIAGSSLTRRAPGCNASRGVLLVLAVALAACSGEPADRARSAGAGAGGDVALVLDTVRLDRAFALADSLPRLRSLVVQWRDTVVRERYWRGAGPDRPTNIKSASKSVLSAVVGAALADGHLESVHQTLGELLVAETRGLEPAKQAITVADLLSMRAGLESTSFDNYGAWVSSRNWVRAALARPLVAPRGEEGGPMIYSTGSSHLLSAVIARATRMTTHRYAQRRVFAPLGLTLPGWTTDPQGIHFGGNEMRMSPRAMLAFGTMYLKRGRAPDGTQVVPAEWVDSSWVGRGTSRWSGDAYGYGWWIRRSGSHTIYYAWGYGGQFIFIVPPLELVVVMTSDADVQRDGGHLDALRRLMTDEIVPAVSR